MGKVSRDKAMQESKDKILAYRLGEPRTYTPTHIFPVSVTWVEPKPSLRPRKVRRKQHTWQKRVSERKVHTCIECGVVKSKKGVLCRACSIANRKANGWYKNND